MFRLPHPVFSSILFTYIYIYMHVSEMLRTFPSSCARFTEVAHVSQKLRTFHRPHNNVRVRLHWGDQTRFLIIYYIFIIHYLFIIYLCFYLITYLFLFIDCSMCLMLDTDWCGPPDSTILRYSINHFLFIF